MRNVGSISICRKRFLASLGMTGVCVGQEGEGIGGEAADSFSLLLSRSVCHFERSEKSDEGRNFQNYNLKYYSPSLFLILIIISLCPLFQTNAQNSDFIRTGAERTEIYLPELQGKRVGLVINQTAIVGKNKVPLADTLLKMRIDVRKIFAPEHGFRGNADAGETVANDKDKANLPIISLYGNNKKPQPEQLSDIDVVIFDIQDVGARFYTYISTLFYVMEACAENNKQLLIFDRPNPNDYVDGPVLEEAYKSFVGMFPIPVLHGLTIGELALMINGENRWLTGGKKCPLKVIRIENWKHGKPYSLPVKPSPNLPNDQAVALYPSLCFFEATRISVGRGTYFPFQVIGSPDKKYGKFTFTPKSLPGFDKNPMHKNKVCYGMDLRNIKTTGGLTLAYLLDFYKKSRQGAEFFNRASWMDYLAGTSTLRKQILAGKTENEIRAGWKEDLEKYKKMRKKYLLYEDY